MADTNKYRRPAFQHRPWITGALWDKYSLRTVLHCDAYALTVGSDAYLLISWTEGGRKAVATDCYLIERDGLTPVWDAGRVWAKGTRAYWTARNAGVFGPVHQRVLAQREAMMALGAGRWSQVTTQCHYVHVREENTEVARNTYLNANRPKTRKRREPRTLPDWL